MSKFEPIPKVIEVTVALDDDKKTVNLDLSEYFTDKQLENPTEAMYHDLEDIIRDEVLTAVKWWWS